MALQQEAYSTLDLEVRKGGIGASEIAAVLGVSKWRDALDVYRDKKGEVKRFDTRQMRFGRFAESFVLDEYQRETGIYVRRNTQTMRHRTCSWALATVDAFVLRRALEQPTANVPDIVDAKTSSEYAQDEWGEPYTSEMPADYFYQGQWQMAVTDTQMVDFVVLFGNRELHIARVKRNDILIADMLAKAERFWFDHVQAGVPPQPTLDRSIEDAFPQATSDLYLPATPEHLELRDKLLILEQANKSYDEQIKQIKAALKAATGDAMGIEVVCRWSNTKGTIDYATACEEFKIPSDVLEQYRGEGSRRFSPIRPKAPKAKKGDK